MSEGTQPNQIGSEIVVCEFSDGLCICYQTTGRGKLPDGYCELQGPHPMGQVYRLIEMRNGLKLSDSTSGSNLQGQG